MAYLVRKQRDGKVDWSIKYMDAETGKWRWISCRSRGATNASLRRALLDQVEAEEEARRVHVREIGGRPRYDVLVSDLVKEYESELDARAGTEGRTDRAGLAPGTVAEYRASMAAWLDFIGGALTTGDLDAGTIHAFKAELQRGKRSPWTINKHLRALRTFLIRYDGAQPPFFRGAVSSLFGRALAAVPTGRTLPAVLAPDELTALVDGSMAGGVGPASLFRPVILHALTGARTHELARLTWDDVDLDGGALTIRSAKTGRARIVPLIGDPSGDVSPGLLRLLEQWRPTRPAGPVLSRAYPRKPWEALRRATVAHGKPKSLRSTWTSYLVSMGRPPSLVAWWAGHSPTVLERHYADYVRNRREGATLDEAMGIDGLLPG